MVDHIVLERVRQLRQEINYNNHRYYVLDSPVVSDTEYDQLIRELRELEGSNPELVTPDSPTQRVGASPAAGFVEVEHQVPMLSLANAFGEAELESWHRRVTDRLGEVSFPMVCELKIDGLAIALTYEDGRFAHGATRGDGYRGEDVTQNLRTLGSIPLAVEGAPRHLEVRGEVYFPLDRFAKLNRERLARGEVPFVSPRNTAAGSLRQLDPRVTAMRPLDIFIYGLGLADDGSYPDEHWATLQWLQGLGFKVNRNSVLCGDLGEVEEYCAKWLERKHELNYGIDGVVVKANAFEYQRRLGFSGREPRWAIAYKFPGEQVITKLLDIRINVGRTGTLNPFAVLQPVRVGGATIKLATLHNENDIRRKDLRIGDWVVVQRAGEVIPQVIAPIPSRRTGEEHVFTMPARCPVCGTEVVQPSGEATTRCQSQMCPAQFCALVKHFVSRSAMDIEGMGEKLVEALVEAEIVGDVADIYYLKKDQLLTLEGMAEKSTTNVLKAITDSKRRPLPNVIFALGILHVGSEVAAILSHHFGSVDDLAQATAEQLMNVPLVGPKIAGSVIRHFQQDSNLRIVDKLREAGVGLEEGIRVLTQPGKLLVGKRFVITGQLDGLSRFEIENIIKDLGGKVSSNVNGKTDYLVVGSKPGSKLNRAMALGVESLSQVQFQKLVGI